MANTLWDMPQTVWRVERADNGGGPYVDNGACPAGLHLLNKHGGCENHPAPPTPAFRYGKNGARRSPSEEQVTVCGFTSLEDLIRWFDSEDRALMKMSEIRDYVVSKYSAPGILWQDEFGQCIFNKGKSEKLETMSIEEAESLAEKNMPISKWVEMAGKKW